MEFCGPELRNNYHLVKLAVQNEGYSIFYASEKLKNKFKIAYFAVRSNGYAF